MRCYDDFSIVSSFVEYAEKLTRHETDILSTFMQIQQQEGQFRRQSTTVWDKLVQRKTVLASDAVLIYLCLV